MNSNDSKMQNNTSVATFLKTKHCGNKNNFNEAYSFLTNKCVLQNFCQTQLTIKF